MSRAGVSAAQGFTSEERFQEVGFGVWGVELTTEQTPEESSARDRSEADMNTAEAEGFRCRGLRFWVWGLD